MRAFALIVLVALAAGGVLFATGAFDAKEPGELEPGVGPAGAGDGSGANPTDRTGTGALAGAGPKDRPDIKPRRLTKPRTVLVVAPNPEPWNQTVLMAAGDVPVLRYAVWYTERHANMAGAEGPGAGEARGVDKLAGPPPGDWLDANDIDAVLLDRIDPDALPDSFWPRLADRVRDGTTGLWVRMGPPGMQGADAATVHPLVAHPIVGDLLPIGEAVPFQGQPLPGVFPQGLSPEVTDSGARHLASRLVAWPRWSRSWWQQLVLGEHAWRVEFAYPVEGVAAGAEVLLQGTDGRGAKVPMLVASSGGQRVLWQAFFDFGRPAQMDRKSQAHLIAWMTHAVAWLAGEPLDDPREEGGN
ncbi:MAG: hypothetical protein AB7T63_10255 [Planctomycetota bacterium]